MSAALPLPPPLAAAVSGGAAKPSPSGLVLSGNSPEAAKKKISAMRARMGKLCKEGKPELARRLFDALPRPVPAVLWNTLLIGYACNSLPYEALRLYASMVASAVAADAYTYSSVLKVCAELRQLSSGEAIHGRILRLSGGLLLKNRVLHNSLLNMYASSPEIPRARAAALQLFDRMSSRNVVSWNTMIRFAARSSNPLGSLRLFREMMEGGIKPSAVSFINVFPAAEALRDELTAMALYGMLIRHGEDYAADPFVASSAICMFSDLGDVSAARRAFDISERNRNTEVWNAMIGGYVQNELPISAMNLLSEMLREEAGVTPDAVTHVAAVTAASAAEERRFGEQIHARALKTSAPPVILSNALAAMYARCGDVQASRELFRRMSDKDIVSWNTIVTALVQKGMDLEALSLVREMELPGDGVTLAAVLSAASNLGEIRPGKEAHGQLLRRGIGGATADSYLVDVYAKAGAVETARRVFDAVEAPDLVTWNAMIAGYGQAGQHQPAIALFRELLSQKLDEEQGNEFSPSAVSLSSILPSCGAVGGLRSVRELHGYATRRRIHENLFVGTSLVDVYAKTGCLRSAQNVFGGMPLKNAVTYTAMISGLGLHGEGKIALSLFDEMRQQGHTPDGATFVAAMAACSHAGMVEEGLAIFNLMEEGEFQVAASFEHHCCVVDMLGRAGRIKEAYDFARELGEKGRFVGIWGSLLAACRLHGKLEVGKAAAARLFEIGGAAGYHVLLSNAHAANGRWGEVDAIRKQMRNRGLGKEPGFSEIQVGEASHRFLARGLTFDLRSTEDRVDFDLDLDFQRVCLDEVDDPEEF